MAPGKSGIYFGRMLNLLVSKFRPRIERDFLSNNPQPIGITAFPSRIYFGRACHKRNPVTATVAGFFFVLFTVNFPFVFPLASQNEGAADNPLVKMYHKGISLRLGNIFDIGIHSLRAGLFHLVCHMPVDIQRECSRSMSQRFLHGLNIVPCSNRCNRIRMPLRYNSDKSEKPRNFKA